MSNLAKRPKGVHQPITEQQRNYQLKIREMRNKWKSEGDANESDSGGELQGNEKDRQPRLNNLAPDYDLKLFMESQAVASEKIVSNLVPFTSLSGQCVKFLLYTIENYNGKLYEYSFIIFYIFYYFERVLIKLFKKSLLFSTRYFYQ